MIFSGRDHLSLEALQQQQQREGTTDDDQMMYVQHLQQQQHPPHLHMLQHHHPHHQQQLPSPPHLLGLSSYQQQDPLMPDPFASSASNYTEELYPASSPSDQQPISRFQHQHRPNDAAHPSTTLHHHHHLQQQHHQLLQHRGGPYVSSAASDASVGYYPTYSQQQMTPAVDPRNPNDRSTLPATASSSVSASSSSSSSSPSAANSSPPLQWTKAQDYACAPAQNSARGSLVFYGGTGNHVAEWNGEFTKDALTSMGTTNNACQQQQQQRRQQLFSDDDDDLNVEQRNLPLSLTAGSVGGSPSAPFISHPSSTHHPIHSMAASNSLHQGGYPPPPSTHRHHHLQSLGVFPTLSYQRSPTQSHQHAPQVCSGPPGGVSSLGPQQQKQQGHSVAADELRVMRGPPVAGGGGGGGGGRMISHGQAPPFDWMKKQIYPITPSSGKTRTKDKYRIVYSEHQKVELEKEFLYNPYITIQRKAELATIIGLSDRQVKIWFQNRRAKERKQKKKRPHQGATGGAEGTGTSGAGTGVHSHHPSKTPARHPGTTPPATSVASGVAQVYPLQPQTMSAVDSRSGGGAASRGCSGGEASMRLEAAAAAAAGVRILLEGIDGGCSAVAAGQVKSESMAPL